MTRNQYSDQEIANCREQLRILEAKVRVLENNRDHEIERAICVKNNLKQETKLLDVIRLLMIPIILNLTSFVYRLAAKVKDLAK